MKLDAVAKLLQLTRGECLDLGVTIDRKGTVTLPIRNSDGEQVAVFRFRFGRDITLYPLPLFLWKNLVTVDIDAVIYDSCEDG